MNPNHCIRQLPLWLSNTHSSLHHSPTISVSCNLPFFLPCSLYPSLFTLWLPWEWGAHTDLIRQPCNDEVCTALLLVPLRTSWRTDSRSALALARGRSVTACSNLPSMILVMSGICWRCQPERGRLERLAKDSGRKSMWKEMIGRVPHTGVILWTDPIKCECVCVLLTKDKVLRVL